jgi:hypothetical protein
MMYFWNCRRICDPDGLDLPFEPYHFSWRQDQLRIKQDDDPERHHGSNWRRGRPSGKFVVPESGAFSPPKKAADGLLTPS